VDQRATGLILRTRPLTETSLIVHWMTPEFGRLATVAKGARRPKSPFRGKLDVFYLVEFSFIRSRRSDLHILREVSLRATHEALRHDITKLHQAAYAAALIEQTTEAETPLSREFDLLKGFLDALAAAAPWAGLALAFELKLLRVLGQSPTLHRESLSEHAQQIAERMSIESWETLLQLRPSTEQLRELRQFLHGFLIYHLGKIPKGRDAALRGD
jgi:DNA repair protein RecO (recombination protein O)